MLRTAANKRVCVNSGEVVMKNDWQLMPCQIENIMRATFRISMTAFPVLPIYLRKGATERF